MLETERLVLRRWRPSDLAPYSEICADPEVMRWIRDGRVRSAEECAESLIRFERSWEEFGFGPLAIEAKDSGRLLGFVALGSPDYLPEILPATEIGWRLARDAWGRGLATEAARAMLAFGFERADLDRIVSVHQIGNDASERIMQKLGMTLERETVDPTCDRRVRVYERARA